MLTLLQVRRGAAVLAAGVLLLGGCTGDDEPKPNPDTPDVDIPEGVTMTSGGATVGMGKAASVVYTPRNAARTVITVKVNDITRGDPKDLKRLDPEDVPDGSVPFYVDVSLRNDGPAVLKNAAIPVYGIDSTDSAFSATRVKGSVGDCKPVPAKPTMDRGETIEGCLLFAVPEGKVFKAVQVRTKDLNKPVTWKP